MTLPDGDDFVPRLLAAITETERIAQEAAVGPWHVNDAGYVEAIYSADGTCVVGGGRWGGEASVFDSTEDALHIVHHHPEIVLRRCAADRDVVERHGLFHSVGLGGDERWCTHCRSSRWPCPDLRDCAAAYGVEIGVTP